jgi:hypothetical protein
MTIYYVATLARYALVDAENEVAARQKGQAALQELHAKSHKKLGHEVPINIRTIREATGEEIRLWRWHQEKLEEERQPRHR